jgi:ABC-type sugar transport system ATPase subunit
VGGLDSEERFGERVLLERHPEVGDDLCGGVEPVEDTAKIAGERLQLTARSGLGAPARSLSGGNQQKVVLGKWLWRPRRLLIMDEPTRGIDVGAKAEIHRLLVDFAEQGIAVLLISSDLPEVLGLAHRIGVMHAGRLVDIVDRGDATPETVIRLAAGGAR